MFIYYNNILDKDLLILANVEVKPINANFWQSEFTDDKIVFRFNNSNFFHKPSDLPKTFENIAKKYGAQLVPEITPLYTKNVEKVNAQKMDWNFTLDVSSQI